MHESEKWKGNRSVVSDSSRPHWLQPTYQAPPSMEFSRQEYGFPIFNIINKILVEMGFFLFFFSFLHVKLFFLKIFLKKWNLWSKISSSWYVAEISQRTPSTYIDYSFLKGILWSTSQLCIREQAVTFEWNLWVIYNHRQYRVCSLYRNLSKRITFS